MRKFKESAPLIFILLVLLFSAYMAYKEKKDENHITLPFSNGEITKIEYKGHSYIGWKCGFGFGMTHDPDCKCKKGIND